MLQDLIPISEENGKQAVNARHLHAFLESKQRFADWIKDRIEKYGLIENQDYVVVNVLSNIDDQKYDIFDKKDTVINLRSGINQRVSAGGSNKKEYALTLDCAKELAMVEGNERGKEARQYFIEKEKQLRHVVKHLSQFEIMQQSLNVLMEQEKRIYAVENKVDMLYEKSLEAEKELKALPLSTENVLEMSLRDKIRQLVNRYCTAKGLLQQIVWNIIYEKLYYNYKVSIRAYKKGAKENLLDVAERNGHLDKIYTIASDLMKEAA